MKKWMVLGLLLFSMGSSLAQKTQNQAIRATDPAQDSKSNSESVPEVMTQNTQFERIVLVRFKFKTDLLEGLKKAVAQEGIEHGVILSGFGSVRGYHYHGVSNRDFPSHNFFVKDPTHPADIVTLNGMVIGGRVHVHITFADDEKAFGGHLEPGTEVFTFATATIGVLVNDTDLTRFDDKHYR